MKINRTLIGNRLLMYRQYLKMSQQFVCDYTGIIQSHLSAVENGHSGGMDTICSLLNFYQKHFNLRNFFSDEFSPLPKNSTKGKLAESKAESKRLAVDKRLQELTDDVIVIMEDGKLQVLMAKITELIDLNKKT